jgi:hypothetical protein
LNLRYPLALAQVYNFGGVTDICRGLYAELITLETWWKLSCSANPIVNCAGNLVIYVSQHLYCRPKPKTVPLRKDTAAELQSFVAGKLPTVQVFKVPEKTADMLKENGGGGIPGYALEPKSAFGEFP